MLSLVSVGTLRSFTAKLLSGWLSANLCWCMGLFLPRRRTLQFLLFKCRTLHFPSSQIPLCPAVQPVFRQSKLPSTAKSVLHPLASEGVVGDSVKSLPKVQRQYSSLFPHPQSQSCKAINQVDQTKFLLHKFVMTTPNLLVFTVQTSQCLFQGGEKLSWVIFCLVSSYFFVVC